MDNLKILFALVLEINTKKVYAIDYLVSGNCDMLLVIYKIGSISCEHSKTFSWNADTHDCIEMIEYLEKIK